MNNGLIERSLARALSNRQTSQTSIELMNDEPNTPEPISTSPTLFMSTRQRRKVHVNTLAQRYNATIWMVEHATVNGSKHISSKCVRQFPQYFPGNTKANLEKASRWWKQRESTLQLKATSQRLGNFNSQTAWDVKRMHFKSLKGRGRKRSGWARELYKDLRSDFERVRSAGVKFSTSVLRDHAQMMIRDAPTGSAYHNSVIDRGKKIEERITIRWVQHFMIAKGIVTRRQTGKLMLSREKELYIEKTVAFQLGELKRAFECGLYREENMENADETHFVFNMNNGRTLGLKGDAHVKYGDVVSGGDPITMMVRITGGHDARIQPPMIIFKNENRSYPIRGVPDNVP